MRNLARLTHAANQMENGAPTVDRRKLPICAEPDCERKVEALPDGQYIEHCYGHASAEERQRYQDAWTPKEAT